MTKKSSPRNKEWEKDRRDRLNKTFDNLAKKLPQYDPSSPFSKIEILQKTITFIEELQTKQKDLLQSECDKVLLKEREEFEQSISVLRSRNSQLAELLKQANITIPNFKAQKFVANLSAKRIESLQEENNANGINIKPEKQKKYSNKLSKEQITKAVKENEEKGEKGTKKSAKSKVSPDKTDKKTSKSRNSKTKEKKSEEEPVVVTLAVTSVSSTGILSIPEVQKIPKSSTISAISSKNVTITHTSLTTPIMATGLFLPVPVVQTQTQPVLIVNTRNLQSAAKEVPKAGKKKVKGRWIQIRPHPIPTRIPFGKLPIPALRSNFIVKKKKRIVRRRLRVKDKVQPTSKVEKVVEKRKSQEKSEEVKKKKPKIEEGVEKNLGKSDEIKNVEEKREEPKNKVIESEKVDKPVNEIIPEPQEISAPLSHSDLSNDIFASLQVPSGGSNPGCLSPTAAFLMTFPVVSSAGGGKNPETTLSEDSPSNAGNSGSQVEGSKEDQEVENNNALLDNLSSFFGGYTGLYPTEALEKTPQKNSAEKLSTDTSLTSNPIRIRTDMGAIPQKPMDTQISLSFAETFSTFDYGLPNNCSSKINSTVFPSYSAMPLLPEMAPSAVNATKSEFTFSLTKTTSTAPCTSYKADSLYNPFSLPTTSSNNSVPPAMDANLGLSIPLNISSTIYPNVPDDGGNKAQGSFTFSLTNTTSAPSYYAKSSTNLNISFPNDSYNTYNPFSFNDPVGIKQVNDTSTNFSFCLTSSSSKTAPIYTSTSTYNTLNPFSIDATLQTSNYRQQNFDSQKNYQFYLNQGQKPPCQKAQSNNKHQQKEATRLQNVQQQQKSPGKKAQNQQSKYHNVNWMTNSDYQVKSNDFPIPPPLDFTHTPNHASTNFSYPPPPPPALGSIDLKSKSDVFFAHPPEENFSWSPNKLSNVLEPPTLHNFMSQTALPTLHGDLALSTTTPSAVIPHEMQKDKNPQIDGYQDQQQSGGNFLSVSQLLVEQGKKGKKSKHSKNAEESNRKSLKDKKQFQCVNNLGNFSEQTYTDNSKGNQQYSNIYSAESLIGYKKDKSSQQNYNQTPLDLPPTGSNLFPGIDLNNDINYNSNILFNPPTSTTFAPPTQNCMSVFSENDFFEYPGKAPAAKVSSQQQNVYYFNKPQNGLPPMDYTAHKGDMKATNSSPMFQGNKFNNVHAGGQPGKVKKGTNAKIPDFYPPPPPAIHPNINYDSSVPSSNYFSVPLGVNSPHLPPAEDPFHLHHLNYSNTLKNLAPTNSTLYIPEGSSQNTSNSLTNFHLSSICPEINDKVRQQNCVSQ
ncbi:uncharacterized protein LOC129804649 [Phlebotomus papatasi]|uniref:uncharacterized protein LOC129804649 n=1 Tax=Phlebotomus papatasi TaxID=29031 RepID=UPI0024844530|nr:uncharacterized protein LOC129804649 [Phlebotomus papatasi]